MAWFFVIAIWLAIVIFAPVWLAVVAWILAVWQVVAWIRYASMKRKERRQAAAKLRFAQEATAPGAGIDRGQ